jgi:hypothetical protein
MQFSWLGDFPFLVALHSFFHMELCFIFRIFFCYAVSVLTSYEDGVVILALLKETDEFTFLKQNRPKQYLFFSSVTHFILRFFKFSKYTFYKVIR